MRNPGGVGGISLRLMVQHWQIEALRSELEATRGEPSAATTQATAAEKRRLGLPFTRAEVAVVLGVSTKTVQRMEAAGRLTRCPNLGTVVRYAARDVLRLASAQ